MNTRRRQQGLRAKFSALMKPARASWPTRWTTLSTEDERGRKRRRTVLVHPVSWYTDGHLVKRPLNGAYALAVFAEWCLAKVKAGRGGDLREATAFYADTRRFMEMILRNRRAGRNLTAKQREGMRPRVESLVEQARSVSSKLRR